MQNRIGLSVDLFLFRASLEAERNSFMLYLRGEVFIRAALVKVRAWNVQFQLDIFFIVIHNLWISRWKERWLAISRLRWESLKCGTPKGKLRRWKSGSMLAACSYSDSCPLLTLYVKIDKCRWHSIYMMCGSTESHSCSMKLRAPPVFFQ